MEEKKGLPVNWNAMFEYERLKWIMDEFGTDQDDENGYMIYDTEKMSDDVLEAYQELVVSKQEAKKQGYIFY